MLWYFRLVDKAHPAAKAFFVALSTPFDSEKWRKAEEIASNFFDGYKTDLKDLSDAWDNITGAVDNYEEAVNELQEGVTAKPPDVPPIDTTQSVEQVDNLSNAIGRVTKRTKEWAVFQSDFAGEYEKTSKMIMLGQVEIQSEYEKTRKVIEGLDNDITKTSKRGIAGLSGMAMAARRFFDEINSGKITLGGLLTMAGQLMSLISPSSAITGGIFSTIGSFLPFDDPVNDMALIKEHRQIGKLIAKGLSEGTRSVLNNTQVVPSVTISAPITISGGTENPQRLADIIAEKIEGLRDDYMTRIVTEGRGITR